MPKVKDIMTGDVITFSPDALIYDCARLLKEKRISGAPVVNGEGEVVGVLSETDIIKLIESKEININMILPSPFDVLELPVRMKIELDKIAKNVGKAATAKVEDIMTKGVITVGPEEDIPDAARIMADRKINRLPVLDGSGKLIGIITRGDVIGAI